MQPEQQLQNSALSTNPTPVDVVPPTTPVIEMPVPIVIPDISMTTGRPVDLSKQRHFLAAFFFSFFLGLFGVDRFYLGKVWTGILKLLTFGGLGVWATIDLSLIISGSMRDKQGNKLIDAEKYKKFAKRTVFWTTTLLLVVVVGSFVLAALAITQLVQNGGIDKLTQQYMPSTGYEINGTNVTQYLTSEQIKSINDIISH